MMCTELTGRCFENTTKGDPVDILPDADNDMVFGYSIEDAVRQGRTRIQIPCEEMFARAHKSIANEASTDMLIKQIHSRLRFSRNYQNLRPYTPFCEETISIID